MIQVMKREGFKLTGYVDYENDPVQGGSKDNKQQGDCGDAETNTYETVPQLLNKLMNAGKRVPKITKVIDDPCPMCSDKVMGIVNDTYVILCNAEGFYGKTGFMHGEIHVCLRCGFIAEHIDEEVLQKIREDYNNDQINRYTTKLEH